LEKETSSKGHGQRRQTEQHKQNGDDAEDHGATWAQRVYFVRQSSKAGSIEWCQDNKQDNASNKYEQNCCCGFPWASLWQRRRRKIIVRLIESLVQIGMLRAK
jgi:hypothetical protein